MAKEEISFERIEEFLVGRDPEKYIVGIEASYHEDFVSLIINSPERGKVIDKHKLYPFLWMKHEVVNIIYGGDRKLIKKAMKDFSVNIKALKTEDADGNEPKRMAEGYKFMATCDGAYNKLVNFFKEGGVDIFSGDKVYPNDNESTLKYKDLFVKFSPDEQFLIQTGKRLFKGMDDYNDVHRLQFDLETEGLDAEIDAIFQIGIKDNKGFEILLETKGDTPKERRDSEKNNIITFFNLLFEIRPDIITAYNSENFDWPFFQTRCNRLGLDITEIAKTLNPKSKIRWKDAALKLGGEQEYYKQTIMWGFNILDISHSVRRAQAINSDIKKWGLKYITEYSGVAKPNRVYVRGDDIHTTWADKSDYAFNDKNGDWYKISEDNPLKEDYSIVKGDYIVQRYLLDDLWETEQIDGIFNQAAYLIAKLLPTSYMRSSTMGTAGQWKLIMAAWSYENDLAIPDLQKQRDFTGGLSRLLEVGYANNVVKLDFAALYPKTQLTWDIFPLLDISGVMKGLLTYVVDKRDEFKFLTGENKAEAKRLQTLLDKNRHKLTPERIVKAEEMIKYNKKLASDYDKKQLPLKILANSFFGAYGAPYIFNWGDSDCAEETTCRGRQSLRLMVRHFTDKYRFRALVGDSVTGRTPIYIKYDETNEIDILPIRDIFDSAGNMIEINGQERDFNTKPFKILTKNGWCDIEYVYRHKTKKDIHRIETSESVVECTSDHSLFKPSGEEITPKKLKRGSKIMLNDKDINNEVSYSDMNEGKAWLIGFFVADGSSVYKNRKVNKYFSKRKGRVVEHNNIRAEWTLNNSDYNKLIRAKELLLKEYGIDAPIKDYRNSSSVYKLKTHYVSLSKEFSYDCYCNNRLKKIPKKILNASKEIKKSFLDGFCCGDGYGDTMDTCLDITQKSQTVLAGIALLSKELGYDYRIISRKDKPNVLNFKYLTHNGYKINNNKSEKKPDEVWNNYKVIQDDSYVYDISADGTFVAGIGNIVCHNTDGFNFAIPDNINDVKYICNASHWKTEKYQPGTELVGLEAVLAEFNEKYMEGRMGLDIDDVCDATINFARKNYANLIDGKVKLVGNSIKSKAMSVYIEEFINTGIKLLLDGKGYEFIELYHKYVEDISNYRIPVAKIASKSKVKMTRENYNTVYCKQKNKAGSFKARQAHMELIEANDLNVDLGDVIYYVNTGDAKSHSDIKTVRDKKTGATLMKFNCKLLPLHEVENNPDFIDDEYNIPKYLDAFNTRIKPLLVCFEPEVRDFVIRNVYKDKKTKVLKLEEKNVFTKSQCKLIAGKPYNPTDQDDYEKDLMIMEDKEIKFWDSVDKLPNFIEQEEWGKIRANYKERKKVEKFESIRREYELLENIFKQLEVVDFDRIKNKNKLPKDLNFVKLANIDNKFYLVSNEWGVILDKFESIFKYEDLAIKRNKYYQSLDTDDDNRDDKYNEFKSEQDFESINHIQSEQLAEDIELLKTHGWVKVMDGYWIESDIVNNDKYDYSKIAVPINIAVAVIKKRIKDLEV